MDKELLLYNYFSNHLSEDEKQVFDNLLETDDEFRAQFNFERDLKRVIKDDKNQDLKMKLFEFEKEIENQIPVKNSTNRFRQWSIAASIVVLFGLGIFGYNTFFGKEYGDLYNTYFQEYPNTVFEITRGESVESLEREAFTAYELKDYMTAIENFDRISEPDKKNYLDFYIGLSYLNLNQLNKAETFLSKTIAENTDFMAEAHWYLAMTYLKMEEKQKAIVELNKLVKDYNYNRELATNLLSELE